MGLGGARCGVGSDLARCGMESGAARRTEGQRAGAEPFAKDGGCEMLETGLEGWNDLKFEEGHSAAARQDEVPDEKVVVQRRSVNAMRRSR